MGMPWGQCPLVLLLGGMLLVPITHSMPSGRGQVSAAGQATARSTAAAAAAASAASIHPFNIDDPSSLVEYTGSDLLAGGNQDKQEIANTTMAFAAVLSLPPPMFAAEHLMLRFFVLVCVLKARP